CTADQVCQQGCCAFNAGTCADPGLAQRDDNSGGCGFGDAAPNCNVAAALGIPLCVAGAVKGNLSDPLIKSA
ncbi:hypothetical protein C8R46DRAFT_812644, partial [Mycena filopes]